MYFVLVDGEVICVCRFHTFDRLLRLSHRSLSSIWIAVLLKDFADFWVYFGQSGRPLTARDVIVKSVCPQLKGMGMTKLVREIDSSL